MSGAKDCKALAVIDHELCKQYMCTGPIIRGTGVPYDIRKVYPYFGYEKYDFEVPTQKEGDSYARYLVRMQEMLQSCAIIRQALDKLKAWPRDHG